MTRHPSPPLKWHNKLAIRFLVATLYLGCVGIGVHEFDRWLSHQMKHVPVAAAKEPGPVILTSKDPCSALNPERDLLSVFAPPCGTPPKGWKPKGEKEQRHIAEYAKGARS